MLEQTAVSSVAKEDFRFSQEPVAHWKVDKPFLAVRFVGKHDAGSSDESLRELGAEALSIAYLDQCHSSRAVVAKSGNSGSADAFWTDERGLVLTIRTADCLPIVLGNKDLVVAIHAGWRGVAEKIIESTLEQLPVDPAALSAWIGPAIGPCCYEVDDDVSRLVITASDLKALAKTDGSKSHLDLAQAAQTQLLNSGVRGAHLVSVCTRCSKDLLFSHRRSGGAAARNITAVWLRR